MQVEGFARHKIGGCFKEDEERIFAVIDIVNREVQAGFEAFPFHDVPIQRQVEPVVRVEPIGIARAILGDERAGEEIVADRDGHRVAGSEHPDCGSRQFLGNDVVTQIDGDIVAAVILCIEHLAVVQIGGTCAG